MPPQVKHKPGLFTLFWLSMFTSGPRTRFLTRKRAAEITTAEIEHLPRSAQLLIADFLQQDNPKLSLVGKDEDACTLRAIGWAKTRKPSITGVVKCRIKPNVWRQLAQLRSEVLNDRTLSELENYRHGRTAQDLQKSRV